MSQKTYTKYMTRLKPFMALFACSLVLSLPVHIARAEEGAPALPAPQETSATMSEVPAQRREQAGLSEPEVLPVSASEERTVNIEANSEVEEFEPVPEKTDADVTVMQDPFAGEYLKGTPANLSKVYWRLRVFDLDDNTAVDNYMLINECDLYQRYIHDDFEWSKIRDAARKVLKKERDQYSDQFEFILPVRLGRYDTEYGGFHLIDGTAFDAVRRMEITGNSLSREICGKTGEIKDYPRNLMLILDNPLTYAFAKVDEHVAQAYIIRKQKEVLDLEYDSRLRRYDRIAYVRLRVNLHTYQGNLKGQEGSILSILLGELEGIDLFEDPYGKMLLSTFDIPKDREGDIKSLTTAPRDPTAPSIPR